MTERIEDVLDRYVDRLMAGEDVASCAAEDPDLADVLMPLLQTTELVAHQLGSVAPSPRFKVAARVRMRNLFFARLARKESRPGSLFLWWQRRWVTAMVTAMVFCLAGLGVLAASFNALPSGFFYPVKTATEEMRLAVTTSEYERTQLQLEYAERRLSEMTSMAEQGDAYTAALLAGEFTRLIVQLSSSTLFDSLNGEIVILMPPDSPLAPSPIEALNAGRSDSLELLSSVLEVAPEELRPGIERLMAELAREFDATMAHLEAATTAP